MYNDVFFPDPKWKEFPNIYDSYEQMYDNIVADIRKFMDDEELYAATVEAHENAVHELYKFDEYLDNLRRFYAGAIDFYPNKNKENR